MTETPPNPPPLSRLPLLELGFVNCPAIPYWVDLAGDPDLQHVNATLASLQARGAEGMPAKPEEVFGMEKSLEVPALGLGLPFTDIYRGVELRE